MAAPKLRIEVDGLKDLRKALREVDKGFARELGQAGKRAAEIVAKQAQGKVPVRTGAAKASVRATAGRGGSVVAGNARAPYFGFLDYGNKVGQGAGVGRGDSQVRPFRKGGRYLWPALSERRGEVVETFEDAMNQLIEKAGLK